MHPQQKAAWFILIVIVGTLVLYLAAVPALSWWFHRTMAEAAGPALGVFGLTGLTGFATFYYYRPRSGALGNQLLIDERDRQLSWRAWTAGMRSCWLFFLTAGMGTWGYLYYVRGLQTVTVPVGVFPGIIMAGFVIFMLAQSLATLHYYGWKAGDAER